MSEGMKDKAKAIGNKIKGEAKDQWGSATDDSQRKAEGKRDKAKGEAQDTIADAKNKHKHK
ncbi:CsbD family protein [Oceanobacillus sp. 1P07AA]|uniref:CsbD family protein n=1 Tax=Oceanobacillus sp. 1P07AA TaxID=3132293 RepID=UPI0039A5AF09